jgi:hypothetical protein
MAAATDGGAALVARLLGDLSDPPGTRLGPFHALIDEWLTADRDAPPKQRHTAKRVFERR